jgi:hypothetical protein
MQNVADSLIKPFTSGKEISVTKGFGLLKAAFSTNSTFSSRL